MQTKYKNKFIQNIKKTKALINIKISFVSDIHLNLNCKLRR